VRTSIYTHSHLAQQAASSRYPSPVPYMNSPFTIFPGTDSSRVQAGWQAESDSPLLLGDCSLDYQNTSFLQAVAGLNTENTAEYFRSVMEQAGESWDDIATSDGSSSDEGLDISSEDSMEEENAPPNTVVGSAAVSEVSVTERPQKRQRRVSRTRECRPAKRRATRAKPSKGNKSQKGKSQKGNSHAAKKCISTGVRVEFLWGDDGWFDGVVGRSAKARGWWYLNFFRRHKVSGRSEWEKAGEDVAVSSISRARRRTRRGRCIRRKGRINLVCRWRGCA